MNKNHDYSARKYNVLVTGIGAVIGYGIIKALRNSCFNIHIVGMDLYNDAVGRYWCDEFIQAEAASSNNFFDFLCNTIQEKNIDIVLLGIEQEMHALLPYLKLDSILSKKLVINNPELISLTKDKWFFYKFLKDNMLSYIPSAIDGEYTTLVKTLGVPFLLKPRTGSASKGIEHITCELDFAYWKFKTAKDFMVQRIIGDDDHEYTVGTFGLGDGTVINTIILQRKLGRDGSTVKAATVDMPELEAEVIKLSGYFKPLGPTNFQFRMYNDMFYLLEINPRFSSSVSLREAFGFNEPEMCIEFFILNRIPYLRKIKPGSAIRYISDRVEII